MARKVQEKSCIFVHAFLQETWRVRCRSWSSSCWPRPRLWRKRDYVSLESFSSDLEIYKNIYDKTVHLIPFLTSSHALAQHIPPSTVWYFEKKTLVFSLEALFNICNFVKMSLLKCLPFLLRGNWKCVFVLKIRPMKSLVECV